MYHSKTPAYQTPSWAQWAWTSRQPAGLGLEGVQLFRVNDFCRRIASPKSLLYESGCLK